MLLYNHTCYWCECPDLYVSYLYLGISRYTYTVCNHLQVCNTDCYLNATVKFNVTNAGFAPAGASTAHVDVTTDVGTANIGVEALGPQETSTTKTKLFEKHQQVAGDATQCNTLAWWPSPHNATVTVDWWDSVIECDETNNMESVAV